MSFRIVRAAISTERDDSLHEARLLLLLLRVADRGDGSVQGITKLAKLDFLLRYPVYLERLLKQTYDRVPDTPMEDYERDTVESKMIRFRYGPWDPRYRRWIGVLVAKGLAHTYLSGRTVHVKLTDKGRHLAKTLDRKDEFRTLVERSLVVGRVAGRLSGTELKRLVYQVVPELTGMPWGEEIAAC